MNMQSLLLDDLFLQVRGITPVRARAIVGVVVALISIVIGCFALVRPGRRKAIIALVVALISIILGVLHLARATGDIGTGSGKLGAIVGLVLGLIGIVLGWLALARSRRMNINQSS